MSRLVPTVDPQGLLEYSVVFTDRALNHMSAAFQKVMRELSATLRRVHGAAAVAIVPGGGTMAMEAVARQLAAGRRCLVLRNGYFSYRWSQILDAGDLAADTTVLTAAPLTSAVDSAWSPPPLQEVVDSIHRLRPQVLLMPHVETASGILLPDDYLRTVATAMHAHGGLVILDGVASGALWVDMPALGVDVLISAPQKGWSAPSCAGLVMLSAAAEAAVRASASSSFALDLGRWLDIMRAYEDGSHAYHATLPTDALARLQQAMAETEAFGFEAARQAQWALGRATRAMFARHGLASVAAPGFEAPGVVVCHTRSPGLHSTADFLAQGVQTASGVPLMCGEPQDFRTFRVGLFGLDKLAHVDRTVSLLEDALVASLDGSSAVALR